MYTTMIVWLMYLLFECQGDVCLTNGREDEFWYDPGVVHKEDGHSDIHNEQQQASHLQIPEPSCQFRSVEVKHVIYKCTAQGIN